MQQNVTSQKCGARHDCNCPDYYLKYLGERVNGNYSKYCGDKFAKNEGANLDSQVSFIAPAYNYPDYMRFLVSFDKLGLNGGFRFKVKLGVPEGANTTPDEKSSINSHP